jgi:glycosyltransferase involved in cell wall biosynthesis
MNVRTDRQDGYEIIGNPRGVHGAVVMLLTNDFVADPRVEKEARALAADGWQVTVLGWDRSQNQQPFEVRGPINIERLGPLAAYGGGPRSIGKFLEFWRRASRRAAELRPQVVHCHDLDTAVAGLAARARMSIRRQRVRLIVDFHELYRESGMVPQHGFAGIMARLLVGLVERVATRNADAILVANPATTELYGAGRVREKTTLVENAPDLTRFERIDYVRHPGEPFRVCFIGQKRYVNGLVALMESVQRDDRFYALLAGGGVAEARVAEAAKRHRRVETVGRLRYEEIPNYYLNCHCVFAVYDSRLGNVRTLFPVKVMEGMACGLPVIVSRGTWIGDYVEREGVGFAVDESDVNEICEALGRLADDPALCARMGLRGREIVEGGLNWQSAAGRLSDVYRRLTCDLNQGRGVMGLL